MSSAIPRNRAELVQRFRHLTSSSAIQSAFWVILGSGGQQFLRLLSNLVLTRLLFPEVFGVMALVTAVIVGLELLSDVGLREGVLNSKRVNDPLFLRTAWTIQIIRGAIIGCLAIAISFPMANFYQEPVLQPILSCVGVIVFMESFRSIAMLLYDKRLDLKTQVMMQMTNQVVGLIVTIVIAWKYETIWAMPIGHCATALMHVLLSYRLFEGHQSRFCWDRQTVHQLFHFGKWIFVSSAISYVVLQGDRLVIGKFMTMDEFGKYTVASTWAMMVTMFAATISGRVLHPFYRRTLDADETNFQQVHKVRRILNAGYASVCVFLALIGELLIRLLYDDRYTDVGWILQILALGQVGRCMTGTLQPFILALGDSYSQMKFSAANATLLISFIVVGGWLAGAPGVILAYTLSSLLAHPIMVLFARRHGYRCMLLDMSCIAFAIVASFALWWLTDAQVLTILHGLLTQPNVS